MNVRRFRVLLLPLAAVLIFAAMEYRLSQPDGPRTALRTPHGPPRATAPALEGIDSANRYFRLNRYLGRQEVIVVFFDGAAGANGNPVLAELKKYTQTLRSRGIHVIAVSSALPQQNRQADFETPVPFVLVTDPDQVWKYHRTWGCLDENTGTAIPRTFFIDRAGRTPVEEGRPVEVSNPLSMIQNRLQ
ncbi:MAG: redoxin domain-containing protein [Planctomycetaceae bacterium]